MELKAAEKRGNAVRGAFPKKTPLISAVGEGRRKTHRVAIAMDCYEDLFSDFDYSPVRTRTISKDLIEEQEGRHGKSLGGEMEITFTLPEKERDGELERIIRKRLTDYFNDQAKATRKELLRAGWTGVACLFGGGVLVFVENLMPGGIANAMVLGGYLSAFSGLDRLGKGAKLRKQMEFYERVGRAELIFANEEEELAEAAAARAPSAAEAAATGRPAASGAAGEARGAHA